MFNFINTCTEKKHKIFLSLQRVRAWWITTSWTQVMFHFTHTIDFIIRSGTCNKVRHTKLRIAFWKEIKWNGKGIKLWIVTRVTQRVLLVEQELSTLSACPVFVGFSLLNICCFVQYFVDHCMSLWVFSPIGHCFIYLSSIYGFCLSHWYIEWGIEDSGDIWFKLNINKLLPFLLYKCNSDSIQILIHYNNI